MTNAQLNTLINTIDTGGLNTALEVRNVLQGIKGEMFNTSHIQEIASNGSNFNYKLTFEKIGNICFISGYFRNDTNTILDASNYAITINNSIYFPKTNESFIINSLNNNVFIINPFYNFSPNIIVFGEKINNDFNLNAPIPIGGNFFFNGHYKINN
jgi:hypothetical protein